MEAGDRAHQAGVNRQGGHSFEIDTEQLSEEEFPTYLIHRSHILKCLGTVD